MLNNDETVVARNLEIVVSDEEIKVLTDAEAAHIRHLRRMSPVARTMVFDLAAENVRCLTLKAGAVLTLVRTPK